MAEFHTPMEEAPAAFPPTAQAQPTSTVPSTTTSTHPTSDPIRSTTSEAMVPESRPEVVAAAADEPAVTGKHTDTASAQPQENKLGTEEAMFQGEPASEGVLGYKAPGLVKSFRFSKKFFWFGDEAVAASDLHQYLRGEKPEVAHHNAAWSSQTGKGLLYFSKSASHKAQPAGIINLADISEIAKEGINEFHFKLHGQKHTFQAGSLSERDSWLVAVQTRAAEAKTTTENITGSAGYKENFGKLGGPSTSPAPIAPATTTPAADSTSPTQTNNDSAVIMPKKDTAAPKATATSEEEGTIKRKQKSRSVSRKRGSIFGSLLGKKEEHDETKELKKEEKAEEKAEKREDKKLVKEDKKLDKEEKKVEKEAKHLEKPVTKEVAHDGLNHEEAAAIAARVIDAPVVGADEIQPIIADPTTKPTTTEPAVIADNVTPAPETTTETAPKHNKRNSLFGGFFQKKDVASPVEEKSEREIAPAVPAKDVPAKDTHSPITSSTSQAAPHSVDTPMSNSAVTTDGELTPATVPHKNPRASSPPRENFFGGMFSKQKDAKLQEKREGSATKPTSTTDAAPVIAPTAASTAPTVDSPVITEPPTNTTEPVSPVTNKPDSKDFIAPSSETTVTAANAEPVKEKRRSSFFSNLGSRREKRVESDIDVVDSQPRQRSASPLPKLGGLFRNPSRAMKGNKDSAKKEPVSPVTANATNQSPVTETKASGIPTEATGETSANPVLSERTHGGNATANTSHGEIIPEAQSMSKPHEPTSSVQAAA